MIRPTLARSPGCPAALALLVALVGSSLAWTPTASPAPLATHRAGELLLKFRAGASPGDVDAILKDLGATRLKRFHRIRAEHVRISRLTVEDALARYRGNPAVEFIEPDYLVRAEETVPDDPLFGQQWALRNVGQDGGSPGADIDATRAWDVTTSAGDAIVAIIDTGVDYTHPDLADNIWRNPGEIPSNGIDDDGNGYVDDVFGYDFRNSDPDPFDDNGHGTHVAGTVGAVGNNTVGVAGIAWHVRLMPLKFLGQDGSGSLDAAIAAIEYAVDEGARILNNSWGGGPYSEALRQAIADADAAGALFVAAAGNERHDTDVVPHYPSGFDLPNVVSVAASTVNDALADFSNYGAVSVHLAAPGVSILSTIPDGLYGYNSGTSMATPHVSGALALLLGRFPAMTHTTARTVLFASADPLPQLTGLVATGARLDVARMLEGFDSVPPAAVTDLATGALGSNRVALRFTAPGDDGQIGTATRYDLRYATAPLDEESFARAASATSVPPPARAGTAEEITVGGLATRTTYFFALRTLDEYGNASPLSNVASATTLGPPDLTASPESLSAALLTGQRAAQTLRLGNAGEGTLDYTIVPEESGVAVAVHAYTALAKGEPDTRVGDPVTAGTGGPDRFGYRWIDSDEPAGPVFDWAEASGSGEAVALSGDDAVSAPLPIGFAFPFYGIRFTELRVCSNGFLSFTSSSTDFTNQILPSGGAPENLVAPFWDDLYLDPSLSRIYRYFDGSRLIIQFQSLMRVGGGGPYTFEAILYPTGEIRFQYRDATSPINSATVGIQNGARDDGTTIAFNTGYARPGLAVRLIPPPRWLAASPGQGMVLAGESAEVEIALDAAGLFTGTYRADLRVRSNDPDTPEALIPVSLHVTGAPDIDVAPPAADFDTVFVGRERVLGLVVSNDGSESLDVTPDPLPAGPFSFDPSPFSLPPGGKQTLSVRYAPVTAGPGAATILLRSNDPDESEVSIPLRGAAVPPPRIAVAPASFDEALLTGLQVERTLVIQNSGESDLTFGIRATEGAPSSTSASAAPAPAVVAGGSAEWASYRAAGPAAGPIVPMSGPGPEASLPVIVVDPPDDGGPVDLVALRAAAVSGVLVVDLEFATSLDPADFGGFFSLDVDQNPSTGAAPSFGNGRQVLGVEYEFQLFGVQAGYVRLVDARTRQVMGDYAATHDEHHIRFSAPLSALGNDDGIMDCGGVVGTSSVPTDWFPDAGRGTIGSVPWATIRPSQGRLPPGGRAEVSVGLSAAGLLEGEYAGRLRIESNDPDQPVTLVPMALHVTGIPDIAVTPDSLDFGTILVGASAARGVRATNVGTGTLHVRSVAVDNPAAYLVEVPSFDLPPGGRLDFEVQFLPLDPGAAPGSLRLQSDDPDEGDLVVPLKGNALLPPHIAVQPDSLDAALLTGQTTERTVTVRNEGLSDLHVLGATRRAPGGPARGPAVLVIQNALSWGLDLHALLNQNFGLDPTVIPAERLADADLAPYDIIITAGGEDDAYYAALSANREKLERFVEAGGIVQYDAATQGANVLLVGGAQSEYGDRELRNRVLLPQHPIVASLPIILEGDYISVGEIAAFPSGSRVVTETYYSHRPTTVEYRYGRGTVIATAMTWEYLALYGYPAGTMLTQSLSYALSLARPGWLFIDPAAATIPPAGQAQFTVRFSAAGLNGGDYAAFAELASDDPDAPVKRVAASLHVTGAPDVALSRDSLSFGQTFVGATRLDSLVVRNAGSDDLHLSIRPVDGVFAAEGFTGSLGPGAARTVRVTFSPPSMASFSDTLRIDSDDPDQPVLAVPLEGAGVPPPRAAIAPDSLAVDLPAGGTAERDVTVENGGESDLSVSVFARRLGSGAPPPAGGEAAGPAVLVIQDVLASGIDLGLLLHETLGLQPKVIRSSQIDATDLGAYDLILTVGAQDASYYYAITTHADRFEGFARAGGVVQYQLGTNGSNVGVAGGARVSYGGDEDRNLVVAPGHPAVAGLPDTLSGRDLNNGVLEGLPPDARVITVAAESGAPTTAEYALGSGRVLVTAMPWERLYPGSSPAAPLLLGATRYSISWAYPGWLALSLSQGSVPPGGRLTVSGAVNAAGLEGGAHGAEIVVRTNDPRSPSTVIPFTLDVAGLPVLAAVPASLDFDSVYTGQSRTLALTLRNTGSGPLHVSSLSIDAPAFRVEGVALDLPAHTRRAVDVVFAPVAPGPAAGSLAIDQDATEGTRTVPLSGTGVPPPVLVPEPASVTSELLTGGEEARTLLIRNEGGSDLHFTAEALNGAPPVAAQSALFLGKGEPDPRPGQVAAEGKGGPDRFGYHWADSDEPGGPAFSWLDIRPLGVAIPIRGDDQTSPPQPIGFEFPFYGGRFTEFRVCTNGWISFTATGVDFTNQPLPSPGAPGNLLAPFWDDLLLGPGASVVRLYDGTKLTLQFSGVGRYGIGGPYTFQVSLYPTGAIIYQYLSMSGPVEGATIGLQNADGTDGLTVAFNAPYLHDRMAIRFSPAPDWLALDPPEASVPAGAELPVTLRFRAEGLFPGDYDARLRVRSNDPVTSMLLVPVRLHVRGVPRLAVAPQALDFDTVYVGSTAERGLTVTNAGTETLVLGAAAAGSPEFRVTEIPPSLAPLESGRLTVAFTPAGAGSRHESLVIQSNDPDSPARVPLAAVSVIPPEAVLLPDRLEAAVPPSGRTAKTLTLENHGGSDLRFEARSPAWGDSGYAWRDTDAPGGPAYSWVDVRSSGARVPFDSLGQDRTLGPFPIGFAFPFYGRSFRSFRVCTNGWISFTSDAVSGADRRLPSADAPENLIAALWDDFEYDAARGAGIWYGPDAGRLVVQFEGLTRAGDPDGSGGCSFEAILEPGGGILLQYRALPGPMEAATVGIQNDLRDEGLTVVSGGPYLREGLAVRLTPPPPWIALAPESGVVPAGGSTAIRVGLDAAGLADGDHAARVRLATNDPAHPGLDRGLLLHVGYREATDASFNPGALQLDSNGRTIRARVELPKDLDPRLVLLPSVRLMDTVPALADSMPLADLNRNGVLDLVLRFDRTAAEAVLPAGEATPVRIVGEVRDKAWFVARDTVRTNRAHGAGAAAEDAETGLPVRFALKPGAPNPFRDATTIGFDLPRPSAVRLAIFDGSGRLVRVLADGMLPAGRHHARWDGRTERGGPAASGVYFVRIRAESFTASRRLLRLR